jgi:general secretion pathway protein E
MTTANSAINILKWLLDEHIILKETHDLLVRRFQVDSQTVNVLIRLGQAQIKTTKNTVLTTEQLVEFVARRMGIEYIKIDPLKVDMAAATAIMSANFATHHKILPIEATPTYVRIAVGNVHDDTWMATLATQVKVPIKVALANPNDIERYTREFFSVARSVKTSQKTTNAGTSNFEQLVDLGRSDKPVDGNDHGIIRVVDWLWQYAFEQRASDIHLEPRRDIGAIRFRIDGMLHTVYQVPLQVLSAMTSRVKSLGRMDVVEKRRPQDGRIKTRGQYGEIEMRLSTLPTAFGEKMVMRIFDPLVTVKTLDELGFPADEAHKWETLTKKNHGIILVTGPTGSGKTTTLYSTLKRVATDKVNVNTIEDPIEMIEPAFNQTQVQPTIDFTFAEGLRALMRQDPDIIMVGEIRDLETAEMAIQAALTGHLVFSTMHTNDAPSAISRLIELGVPAYLISATVIGVLAQRLVRTLCPICKVPDDEDNKSVVAAMLGLPTVLDYQPYKALGCASCRNTGFKGRQGVYELLTLSEEFKDHIHANPVVSRLREQGIKDGMVPLRVAGLGLYMDGKTTLESVIESTPDLAVRQRAIKPS